MGQGQLSIALFSRPWVVSEAMDINIDSDCIMAMNTDFSSGSSPGLDITIVPERNQANPSAQFSLHSPLQIWLCLQDMNHSVCLFFTQTTPMHLLIIIMPVSLATQGTGCACVCSSQLVADHPGPLCGYHFPALSVMGLGKDPVSSFLSISRLDPWNSFSVSLTVA